ncbi:hypothetical protein KDA_76910 [Dictyobacter alpinus]|uniref:Uncharacterized protein n=1 Tax=Dictyobacter alpinus TaxID=2014873 RepID=A0A402BLH8_9CHLR|nr:hypothetical protein [Dictyobacter alpinus]GCE32207.1 hypothetical protein KDA_76910 [Dictyobacter alpinus]
MDPISDVIHIQAVAGLLLAPHIKPRVCQSVTGDPGSHTDTAAETVTVDRVSRRRPGRASVTWSWSSHL